MWWALLLPRHDDVVHGAVLQVLRESASLQEAWQLRRAEGLGKFRVLDGSSAQSSRSISRDARRVAFIVLVMISHGVRRYEDGYDTTTGHVLGSGRLKS